MGTGTVVPRTAFKKGEKKPGQGRPKGCLNKANQALREMICQALDEQPGGGVAYLKQQATENPAAFMTLLGKILPVKSELSGPDGGSIPVAVNVNFR